MHRVRLRQVMQMDIMLLQFVGADGIYTGYRVTFS